MKIAVCVKQVPDTWAEKRLRPEDSTLDRESADGVMNELDEYAVEEALKLTEAHGGEVVVVTMGPDRAGETVRKALSMGADAGIHVVDDGLRGSDAIATSAVLAGAIAGRGFDLVIFGSESTDARMSVVPAMVAERLGWAQLTFAQRVDVSGSDVTIERVTESGFATVTASTPRWCRSWRRSTSRATRRSRGSWPPRRSRSRRWRSPTPGSTLPRSVRRQPGRGQGLRRASAEGGRRRGDRRGRRRRQAGRVPLRAEVHLGSLSDE